MEAKRHSLLIFVFILSNLAAQAAGLGPIPPYKVGEVATGEIVSPIHLIVIDHERTEKLRQAEAQRTPAVYRFLSEASDDAEASLRAAFAETREEFLNTIEANYAKRTLNELAVTYPRFHRLVTTFQQSRDFPLSTNLAVLWALGDSGESIQTNMVEKLRAAMANYIRPDALPPEGKVGPRQVKMIAVKATDTPLDLALIDNQATNFFRTNFYTLSRVRKDLQNSFPPEERKLGKFLVGFVKPNCWCDVELTRQNRKNHTEAIWAADEYEPGEIIVKRGGPIDTRIKAVLDQLRERAAGVQAKKDLAKGQLDAQVTFTQLHDQAMRAQSTAQTIAEQNQWLLGGIGAVFAALIFVLWRLARWKRSQSLLPVRVRNDEIAGTVISCPSCTGMIVLPLELTGGSHQHRAADLPAASPVPALAPESGLPVPAVESSEYWKQRALAAESRVEKSGQVLKAAMIPYFARWLMNKVVSRLAFQRRQLLETQQKAEQELAELEQRLLAVEAPLEDRLKAYEERIAELEKGLTVKGEENRELIKATIAMAKKKLEMERSKDRLPWN